MHGIVALGGLIIATYITCLHALPVPPTGTLITFLQNIKTTYMGSGDFILLVDVTTHKPIPCDAKGNFPANYAANPANLGSMSLSTLSLSIPANQLTTSTSYELMQDPAHISTLQKNNRLNATNAPKYQKIMLFIVVNINGTSYKLYLNDPWPGPQRPAPAGYPADQTIAQYNL